MKILLTAVNKLELRLWWNYVNQINENLKNAYLALHVCDEKFFRIDFFDSSPSQNLSTKHNLRISIK